MRIAFLLSGLLWTAACAGPPQQQAATPPPPSSVRGHTENGSTRLEIQKGSGDRVTVDLTRDQTIAPQAEPARIDVVGELPGIALVLVDRYPSLPGGLSFCQAGEENFLRVVSLAKGRERVTLQIKVASCRDNLELADAGIEWLADSRSVRINWLAGPRGEPETRRIEIGADGEPRQAPSR